MPTSHTENCRVLKMCGVNKVSDLSRIANVTPAMLLSADSSYVVKVVSQKCNLLKEDQHLLRALLDSYKQNYAQTRFGQLSTEKKLSLDVGIPSKNLEPLSVEFSDEYDSSDDDKDDVDYSEFDDEFELYPNFPNAVLLIDTLPMKGDMDLDLIEDFLENYVSLYSDHKTLTSHKDIATDILQTKGWPTDCPIYVSKEALSLYAEIVSVLILKADLILRGVPS